MQYNIRLKSKELSCKVPIMPPTCLKTEFISLLWWSLLIMTLLIIVVVDRTKPSSG